MVVFDLAGSVKDFRNAIDRIAGLEFLSELLGDRADADDDFHMFGRDVGRTDSTVPHSLYLVMSNARAIDELLRLFDLWQQDQSVTFERGLGRFKAAFEQLTAIRRWDRRGSDPETGLLDRWAERLAVAGQSFSPFTIEVEFWYRREAEIAIAGESHLRDADRRPTAAAASSHRSQIGHIGYHALLAETPGQQVHPS